MSLKAIWQHCILILLLFTSAIFETPRRIAYNFNKFRRVVFVWQLFEVTSFGVVRKMKIEQYRSAICFLLLKGKTEETKNDLNAVYSHTCLTFNFHQLAVDFSRQKCSEEGKNGPISREGNGDHFLGFSRCDPHRLFGEDHGAVLQ